MRFEDICSVPGSVRQCAPPGPDSSVHPLHPTRPRVLSLSHSCLIPMPCPVLQPSHPSSGPCPSRTCLHFLALPAPCLICLFPALPAKLLFSPSSSLLTCHFIDSASHMMLYLWDSGSGSDPCLVPSHSQHFHLVKSPTPSPILSSRQAPSLTRFTLPAYSFPSLWPSHCQHSSESFPLPLLCAIWVPAVGQLGTQ